MPDFEVYWKAGIRARLAEPLYRIEDQHYQLKYLPGFAVLAIPAGLLPLDVAKACWFVFSVGAHLRAQRAEPASAAGAPSSGVVARALTVVAMGKFYGHELVLGQVNLLLAVLVASAIVAMRANREGVAGALVATAVIVKPYAIILVPWLVARRRIGIDRHGGVGAGRRADPAGAVLRGGRHGRAASRVVADGTRLDGAEPAES